MIWALRSVLLDGLAPRQILLIKLSICSILTFGLGLSIFRIARKRFYDYI
jgi:ABC-type polysaccharide/polyol phosphate export permease